MNKRQIKKRVKRAKINKECGMILSLEDRHYIRNYGKRYDERCGEASETFLDYVTKEQEKDLEEKLNAVLNEWLTKYHHQPTFYYLDNIEKVRLEEDAE